MYNVVVRSLQEDLKAIGLLSEDVLPEEDEVTTDPELEGDDDDKDGELEERVRIKRRIGTKKTLARTPMKELLRGRRYRRGGKGKAAARKREKKYERPQWQTHKEKVAAAALRKGTRKEDDVALGRITDLISEIKGLVDHTEPEAVEIDRDDVLTEAHEGFGYIQEIAALLSEAFRFFANEDEDEELAELADSCVGLANLAGTVVDAIEEGDIEDLEALQEAFESQFSVLLDACEVYESIVEGDDQGED